MSRYQTKQKKIIHDFLEKNSNNCFTALDIIEYFKTVNEIIGQATIYRYLNELEIQNKIIRYNGEIGTSSSYQYVNDDCHIHFHLKCIKCNKLIHLECDELNNIEKHIKNEHNFLINGSKTVLYGLCSKCRKEE